MIETHPRQPALREMQEWMASLVLQPDRLRPELARPEGPGRWVLPSDPQQAAVRMQAYTGGYPARIREALEESFPAIARIIGPDRFTDLTERYVRHVTLRSYNLNDAGRALPEFLRADSLIAEFPFLPDLAALEWQVTRAFHARQIQPLDPRTLSHWGLDEWGKAVFRFQPSMAIVESDWPIRRIWHAAQRQNGRLETRRAARRTHVLVRRAGFAVRCESLTAAETHALVALRRGQTLGEVTEGLSRRTRAANVSRWFTRWMAMGLIAHGSGPQVRRVRGEESRERNALKRTAK